MNHQEKKNLIIEKLNKLSTPIVKEIDSNLKNQPIAIIGLSGYLPQSMSVEDFWSALDQDKGLIEEIPLSRFDYKKVYDPTGKDVSKSRTKWGGFISDIRGFDPYFFNILPSEAEIMDPRQRLLLMSTYHSLENAGISPVSLKGSKTGVFVAIEDNEYLQLLIELGIKLRDPFGQATSMVANRLSYFFDFRGPSEIVNTMCSGAAVAIHRAVKALQSNEIELAVVGGANIILRPDPFIVLSNLGQMSPENSVRSFGKNSNGYLRSEGVATIVLKRLSDVSENDTIHAVIKNSAINFNGRGGLSISAPNIDSHSTLIQTCYEEAGVDPRDITYIEAQGMGNPVADIAEWEAFNRALKAMAKKRGIDLAPGGCGISTLKPMIGHMHSTSALGALFKIIRSFQTNKLHKILNFTEKNLDIDTKNQPCRLLQETEDWLPKESPRLAGLHSYGSGGNNAHLLIEEYITSKSQLSASNTTSSNSIMIVLSAKNTDGLKLHSKNMLAYVEKNTSLNLTEMAYTLQVGRDPMEERLGILTTSTKDLLEKLKIYIEGKEVIEGLYIGTIKKNKDGIQAFCTEAEFLKIVDNWIENRQLSKILEVWTKGFYIDWVKLYGEQKPKKISLPTYPFAKERYWIEPSEITLLNSKEEKMKTSTGFMGFAQSLSSEKGQVMIMEGEIETTTSVFLEDISNNQKLIDPSLVIDNKLLQQKILSHLKVLFGEVFKLSVSQINEEESFEYYGVDSILMTRLNQKLTDIFGDIPKTLFFEHKTLKSLSDYIASDYSEAYVQWVRFNQEKNKQIEELPLTEFKSKETKAKYKYWANSLLAIFKVNKR